VDLGKALAASGARRPLELERVAGYARDVEIPLDRPRAHMLPVRLHDGAEVDRLAARRLAAELLLELARGRAERVLALLIFTLGDRPRMLVPADPEGTAGVHEQDLDLAPARAPEQEQAGAACGGHAPSYLSAPSRLNARLGLSSASRSARRACSTSASPSRTTRRSLESTTAPYSHGARGVTIRAVAQQTAEKVLYEVAEGIATITLNDPETRNALSPELLGGLSASFERAREDGEVRCIVLRSSHEKTFSSGANLSGFAADAALVHKHFATEGFVGLFKL